MASVSWTGAGPTNWLKGTAIIGVLPAGPPRTRTSRREPGGITIEWRLHPVAQFERPEGLDTYDVFTAASLALAQGAAPPRPVEQLWDGLEAFAAYGNEVEPATLGAATTEALGIPANACGVVDHQRIGDEWERTRGETSIIDALLTQLSS